MNNCFCDFPLCNFSLAELGTDDNNNNNNNNNNNIGQNGSYFTWLATSNEGNTYCL